MKALVKVRLVTLIVAIVSLTAVSAFAFPIAPGNYNGVFFKNSEVFLDEDADGLVSQGDIFWGVINLNGILNSGNDASG